MMALGVVPTAHDGGGYLVGRPLVYWGQFTAVRGYGELVQTRHLAGMLTGAHRV